MRTQFPTNYLPLITTLKEVNTHGIASLIAKSDIHERMTKKSRADKSLPPEWSQGLICLTRSVVSVNHTYEKAVQNQIAKNGFDPKNFQVEASTVSNAVAGWPNTLLREGLKNVDQLYVRVFIEMGVKSSLETYYLNALGENVTDKVTRDFRENFFPKEYGAEKQMLAGSGKEIKPREYKAENIIYFQKGDVIFNALSKDLYKLFNLESVSA